MSLESSEHAMLLGIVERRFVVDSIVSVGSVVVVVMWGHQLPKLDHEPSIDYGELKLDLLDKTAEMSNDPR